MKMAISDRPTLSKSSIQEALSRARSSFLKDHKALLDIEVNERSLTHKLAECLTPSFPDWDVDCEYNRDGYDHKKIGIKEQSVQTDDINGKTVYPDIIVHHRTKRGRSHNLLVIEAKKNPSHKQEKYDIRKLTQIKDGLKYQYAAFIKFAARPKKPGIIYRFV